MTTHTNASEAIDHHLSFIVLDEHHCEKIEELQKKVRDHLSPDIRHFSSPKTLEQLRKNMRHPNFAVGAAIGEHIVGVVFAVESLDVVLKDGIKERKMDETFIEGKVNASVTTLLVHPDYKGNGIAGQLLGFLRLNALETNFKFAVSRIAKENEVGMAVFKKAGWKIVGRGTGDDNHERVFVELTVAASLVPREKLAANLFRRRPILETAPAG